MNAETNINNMSKDKNKKKKRSPGLVAGMILVVLIIILLITLAMFMSYDEVTNVFLAGKLDIVLTEEKWDKLPPEEKENIVPNAELDKDPKIINKEVDADVFLEVTVPYVTLKIDDNDTNKGQLLIGGGKNWTTEGVPAGSKYEDVPLYKFMINTGTAESPVYEYNTDYSSPAQKVNSDWYLMRGSNTNVGDDYNYTEKDETNHTYIYRYAYVSTEQDGTMKNPLEMHPLIQGGETQTTLFDKIKLVNFRENDSEFKFDRNRDYSIKVESYGIQAYFLAENNTTKTNPYDVWNILKNTIN